MRKNFVPSLNSIGYMYDFWLSKSLVRNRVKRSLGLQLLDVNGSPTAWQIQCPLDQLQINSSYAHVQLVLLRPSRLRCRCCIKNPKHAGISFLSLWITIILTISRSITFIYKVNIRHGSWHLFDWLRFRWFQLSFLPWTASCFFTVFVIFHADYCC